MTKQLEEHFSPSVCLSVRSFVHGLLVSWGATGWQFVINFRTNIYVPIDCSTVLPLVLGVVTRQKPHISGSVVLGADESPWPCGTPSWYAPLSWMILSKQKNLHLFSSQYICVFSKTSVCLSVTPFSPSSCHRIITKFSGVITIGKSDVHAKGQGQRWKVKVTEVITPLSHFRTITPVWIHIWRWNDAQSLMLLRRGALLSNLSNFKVTRLKKIIDFDPNWAFPDCNSILNSPMAMKWCTKLEAA